MKFFSGINEVTHDRYSTWSLSPSTFFTQGCSLMMFPSFKQAGQTPTCRLQTMNSEFKKKQKTKNKFRAVMK